MVNTPTFILSLFSPFFLHWQTVLQQNAPELPHNKSIAVIGAGSAGLAVLKTILDLPESTRAKLDFALYEKREDVGGVWLPESKSVQPPTIPETALYPLLRTNTPVPHMTYPGFPFPKGTPLYPSHPHIAAYHRRYSRHHGLYNHIHFKHELRSASWEGNETSGQWNLVFSNQDDQYLQKKYDHLIVATGNNHFPRLVTWTGQDEWQAHGHGRKMLHSVYYRNPQDYAGLQVLIVGNGSSGRDIASQLVGISKKVYMSVRNGGIEVDGAPLRPAVSHFNKHGVVFVDGTEVAADVVIVCTGYEHVKPFLNEGHMLQTDRGAHSNDTYASALVTNTRYIFPLYRHILSLSPEYPTNALAFIGLPSYIANCPSDIAQSLFAVHAILNPGILGSRESLLAELNGYEEGLRKRNFDPYIVGHQLNGTSVDYQDELVGFLKAKGVIRDDGKKFVEDWRRDILTYQYLRRGWRRLEALGQADEWVKDAETEEQWADVMSRLNAWQKQWEDDNGVAFRIDADLAG
ncbi:hypothetical protein CVT24_000450 [Panaeolus cyanescens]|uniref:FAD/NAD(P)-binding domain-containing protein n=1 Tax=Panaeolus cyanescens TaxID=181874 RepID=A0A409V8B5_9AGAR|nr:hypothetical protein CVT24_000450 [Panaeolus cyanescens]